MGVLKFETRYTIQNDVNTLATMIGSKCKLTESIKYSIINYDKVLKESIKKQEGALDMAMGNIVDDVMTERQRELDRIIAASKANETERDNSFGRNAPDDRTVSKPI